jgi:dTDP-glucose 4,6-dehydratase/UDP-glucuronate decarboxylase
MPDPKVPLTDESFWAQAARDVVAGDLEAVAGTLKGEFAQLAGKRLLITGGAGFLGYYLVQAPLAWNGLGLGEPIEVTVFDNYSRGVPGWLEVLQRDPNLELVRHDVTHPLPLDMPPFDYVIHAASIASPTFYRQHPIETMDANVNGLRQLLDWAVERAAAGEPVSGFLFFSTSEIYGDPPPEEIPTAETYRGNVSCTGPRACYDESKRYGETLCVNFARHHGLPVTVARPFNNYGPGLKLGDRRVLPDFARDVLAGRDIVLLSDGTATRTFCYVADAVAGYFKVLVRGAHGEAYNIGTDAAEVAMGDLAQQVVDLGADLFGYEGTVVKQESADVEYLTDNPSRRCPVIEKARQDLGYAPEVGLEDGLRRALVWYAGNREDEER